MPLRHVIKLNQEAKVCLLFGFLSVPLEKTLIRLGVCPGRSESSLGAHSFCWFCHVGAQMPLRHVIKLNQEAKVCLLFGFLSVPLEKTHHKDNFFTSLALNCSSSHRCLFESISGHI